MGHKTFSRMLLLVLAVTMGVFGLTQSSDAKVIPNAYIVQVADTADVHHVADSVARFTGGNAGHIYTKAVRGFAIRVPPGIKKRHILAQPGVVLVEPDLEVTVCAQTLPTGVDRIDVDLNNTAKIDCLDERVDVNIAIIDTGIDIDHPDLNVVGGRHFWSITTGPPWDRSRQDDDYDDDNGHGSNVAGIAAAIDNDIGVVGVAPGARLWAVKVLDASGSGYLSDVIAGVDWVTGNADQIEVANMSLSATGTSDTFRTAIQTSIAAGVVHVVAAGNAKPGEDPTDVYGDDGIFNTDDDTIPAAYPEAATVSAMADSDGQPGGTGGPTSYGSDDSFASLSNFSNSVIADNPVNSPGAAIDLLAPGIAIYSAYKNGGYATMSGTSMASPHAAGLAALYIAENGRAIDANGVYAIRQALIDTGVAQDSTKGLAQLNDPDANWENIGWAGIETYTISASAGANGSIDPAGDTVVNYGDNLAFTATPDTGYEVDTWSVDSNSVQSGGTGYTLTNIQANHTVNVTFKQLWYAISGYVTEPDANIPVEGVFINANNGGGSDTTAANGYYQLTVDYGWSGTVDPNKTGYTFEPNRIDYNNVTTDQNDSYIAILDTFIISGYADEMLTPLEGVLVSPDNDGGPFTSKYYGGSDTTDANGYYEALVDYNFSGKVVPSKYAYAFEPNSISYANVIEDQNDQNYAGTLLTFSISGHILNPCAIPIADIVVDANNGGNSDTTDANGYYEVWVDYNWFGTVTPSKTLYTFDPNSKAYTDVLEDRVGQDYGANNIYDLDCNGSIGWGDVAVIAENWLQTGPDVPGDIYKDETDTVNFLDFAKLAENWH